MGILEELSDKIDRMNARLIEMDKKRPIIRIWDLGNAEYQVDVDTLKITKNQAYSIMSVLAKIYKDEVKPNSSQD